MYVGHALIPGAGRVVLEIFPFHRPAEGLDTEHHLAVLEQAYRTVRLADRDGHRLGGAADGGGGPMPGTQALGQGDRRSRRVDVAAGGLDRALCPVNLFKR